MNAMFSIAKTAVAVAVLAAGMILVTACAPVTSGRHYRLAKETEKGELAPPIQRSGDPGGPGSKTITQGNYFGIKINGGMIKYLEAIERAEVAIFVQVYMRNMSSSEERLVWQNVYVNTEDHKQHMVLNKDSWLPLRDITILPPFRYDGQDVRVQLRIVELDQEDNRRMVQLLNVAATTGAQFSPQSASMVSLFQTVLSFIVQNNPDDIEFQYDFTMSNVLTAEQMNGEPRDNHIMPHFGRYAVIKTEHVDRINYPNRYDELVVEGAVWTLAEVLKIGTLNIANWEVWERDLNPFSGVLYFSRDGEDDSYHDLFMNPLRVPNQASMLPPFSDGKPPASATSSSKKLNKCKRCHTYPCSINCQIKSPPVDLSTIVRGSSANLPTLEKGLLQTNEFDNEIFIIVDNELAVDGHKGIYEDKSYILMEIYPAAFGADLDSLSRQVAVADQIKDIGLRTTQLTGEEFKQHLESVSNSIKGVAMEKRIREFYGEKLANAKSPADIEQIKAELDKELKILGPLFTDQTRDAVLLYVRGELNKVAKEREKQLVQMRTAENSYIKIEPKYFNEVPKIDIEFIAEMTEMPEYEYKKFAAYYKKSTDYEFKSATVETKEQLNWLGPRRSKVTIKNNNGFTAGEYNLMFTFADQKKIENTFFVVKSGNISTSDLKYRNEGSTDTLNWNLGNQLNKGQTLIVKFDQSLDDIFGKNLEYFDSFQIKAGDKYYPISPTGKNLELKTLEILNNINFPSVTELLFDRKYGLNDIKVPTPTPTPPPGSASSSTSAQTSATPVSETPPSTSSASQATTTTTTSATPASETPPSTAPMAPTAAFASANPPTAASALPTSDSNSDSAIAPSATSESIPTPTPMQTP